MRRHHRPRARQARLGALRRFFNRKDDEEEGKSELLQNFEQMLKNAFSEPVLENEPTSESVHAFEKDFYSNHFSLN